jgi:cold shock protein
VATNQLRGRVKSWDAQEGTGVIEADDAPADVWVIWIVIEMPGFRELREGELVAFRYEQAEQDGYHYRATWVRRLHDMDDEEAAPFVPPTLR